MLAPISVIAFDLDDTLWPCMPVIDRAESVLYAWMRQHYPRITRSNEPAQLVALRREFSQRDLRYQVDMTALRRDFLHFLGDRHGYDADRFAAEGFEIFFTARQQVEFYDDVMPCLERLARRFRLGVISNGNASVDHVGLGHLIEHAVRAGEVPAAKPDPLIYRWLAERFEVDPERILYVGDHPHYDVEGARGAGCQAVWINRERLRWPEELPEPIHEVVDLHGLEALLVD